MTRNIWRLPLYRWLLPSFFILAAVILYTAVPGFSFSGQVCFGIAGILLFYNVFSIFAPKYPQKTVLLRRVFTVMLCVGLLVLAITGAIIVNASLQPAQNDASYVVVLGCQVFPHGPSNSLQDRIDCAFAYLTENPESIAILSGGQGPDEPMTEAQCMFEHLTARGIAPERLWLEEKASSTWENIRFSLALIEEKTGKQPAALGILSSEFHIFRATLFTEAAGIEAVPIPAKTTWIPLLINNYLREIAGVWHYIILGD